LILEQNSAGSSSECRLFSSSFHHFGWAEFMNVYVMAMFLLVRFTQGIFGDDLANYQFHHPSNPQQPIQPPYV
jgi:hypothetical protein